MAGDEWIGLRAAGFSDLVSVIAGGAEALDGVMRWAGNPPGVRELLLAGYREKRPVTLPGTGPAPRPAP